MRLSETKPIPGPVAIAQRSYLARNLVLPLQEKVLRWCAHRGSRAGSRINNLRRCLAQLSGMQKVSVYCYSKPATKSALRGM